MTGDPTPTSDALAAAAERRVTLKQAVSAVETAAASPAADPSWREANIRELRRLRQAFDDHVAEVEADDGLLRELSRDAPRLQNAVNQLEHEHPTICAQIDAAIALASEGGTVDEVRSSALDALFAIARHRQKGADLVYKAYTVDIGGTG